MKTRAVGQTKSPRYDAMLAGEAGADYVLCGHSGKPLSDAVERVAGWAELGISQH